MGSPLHQDIPWKTGCPGELSTRKVSLPGLNDSLASKFRVAMGIGSITDQELYLNRDAFAVRRVWRLAEAAAYVGALLERTPGD